MKSFGWVDLVMAIIISAILYRFSLKSVIIVIGLTIVVALQNIFLELRKINNHKGEL